MSVITSPSLSLLVSPCALQFQRIFDDMPVATTVIANYRYVYANRAMGELLGREVAEIIGRPVAELLTPAAFAHCVEQGRQQVAAGRRSFQIDIPYLHRDGHVIETRASDSLICDDDGVPVAVFMQVISVDWQREMALRLAQAHEQRDLLVREVHHRIKNNLQSVAGLLQRQLRRTPAAADALRAAIAQVETIAVVHGLQSGSGDGRGVQLCDIVASIVAQSNQLYPAAVERCVLINALATPALLSADETVALALVCNELVTNALKHGDDGGAVEITLNRFGADEVSVAIVNGAAALPAGFDFDSGAGAGQGLRLVRALLPAGATLQFHRQQHQHLQPQSQQQQLRAELTLRAPLIQSTAESERAARHHR